MVVYKTTNLVTGKFYVGLDTKNDPQYLGSGSVLKKAIRKYGQSNFKKEILEVCETLQELREREKFWIQQLSSQTAGYNVADGGLGGDTFTNNPNKEEIRKKFRKPHSLETRQKISDNNWQKKNSGEKNPNFGKKQTPETKEKRKQTFLEKGEFPNSGKRHTSKANESNREKHLGKKASTETKNKMRLAKIGKPQTKITCPHCGQIGGTTMYRWHFNNCKQKT
jgi:group I intron endonuclease